MGHGKSLPRSEWPDELKSRSGVVGVYVGGCIERAGRKSSFRASAHAHISRGGRAPRRGWICFRAMKNLENRQTVLHELAHIISDQGHTTRFRKILLELGGDIEGWSTDPRGSLGKLHSWTPTKPELHQGIAPDQCRNCGTLRRGIHPSREYHVPGKFWPNGGSIWLETRPACKEYQA